MLTEIEKDSHSLKNLFDVILHDAEDQPLSWTKGLVMSSSLPTFAFEVSSQNAGSTKGYTGWSLPESLSLSMYETRQHDLEKYLLDWIFGEKGIFDLESGAFRAVDKESYLYRKITFRTTTYEVKLQGNLEHQRIEINEAVSYTLNTVMDLLVGGKVSLSMRQNILAASTKLSENFMQEYTTPDVTSVDKAQAVPVLDKITSAVSQVINQLTTRTPVVSILTAPVVVPTPVLRVPVVTTSRLPRGRKIRAAHFFPKNDTKTSILVDSLSTTEASAALREGVDYINTVLSKLPKGEATEKTTSTAIYRVALQGYNVSQYDYSTGEPVTYDLQLPLIDYTLPEFVS